MSRFGRALRERQTDPEGRRWVYVPNDQLSNAIGSLSREEPDELGIVLVDDERVTAWVRDRLAAGERLRPDEAP